MFWGLFGANVVVYVVENVLFYFDKPAIIYPVMVIKGELNSSENHLFNRRSFGGSTTDLHLLHAALWAEKMWLFLSFWAWEC